MNQVRNDVASWPPRLVDDDKEIYILRVALQLSRAILVVCHVRVCFGGPSSATSPLIHAADQQAASRLLGYNDSLNTFNKKGPFNLREPTACERSLL